MATILLTKCIGYRDEDGEHPCPTQAQLGYTTAKKLRCSGCRQLHNRWYQRAYKRRQRGCVVVEVPS